MERTSHRSEDSRVGPHNLEDAVQPYLRVRSVPWVYGARLLPVYRDEALSKVSYSP